MKVKFFLLTIFCVLLNLNLPAKVENHGTLLRQLKHKYESFLSGKVVFSKYRMSKYYADTLVENQELTFSVKESKPKKVEDFSINLYVNPRNASFYIPRTNDSLFYINHFQDYRSSNSTDSQFYEELRFQLRKLPFIEIRYFFGRMRGSMLKVKYEDEHNWYLGSSTICLTIMKKDTLIKEIEYFFSDYYERISIHSQEFDGAYQTDITDLDINTFLPLPNINLTKENATEALIGTVTSDFSLINLAGDSIHLHDFLGDYVVLDFWYIGCKPCIDALPELMELYNKSDTQYVKIIGIEMFEDNPVLVNSFIKGRNVGYEILIAQGNSNLIQDFNIKGYPTFVIISPLGKIIYYHTGFYPGRIRRIEKYLEKRSQY